MGLLADSCFPVRVEVSQLSLRNPVFGLGGGRNADVRFSYDGGGSFPDTRMLRGTATKSRAGVGKELDTASGPSNYERDGFEAAGRFSTAQ